jgi:hypothetical protein
MRRRDPERLHLAGRAAHLARLWSAVCRRTHATHGRDRRRLVEEASTMSHQRTAGVVDMPKAVWLITALWIGLTASMNTVVIMAGADEGADVALLGYGTGLAGWFAATLVGGWLTGLSTAGDWFRATILVAITWIFPVALLWLTVVLLAPHLPEPPRLVGPRHQSAQGPV